MLCVLFTLCMLLPWVSHLDLIFQLNPLKILGQHPQSRKRAVFLGEVRQHLSLLLWPSSCCLHGCSLSWAQVGIQRNLHNFWEFQAAGWRPVTWQILSDLGSPAWPFPGACSKPEYPPKEQLLWLSVETDSGPCFTLCLKYLPPYDLSRSREVNSRPLPHCCIWHH